MLLLLVAPISLISCEQELQITEPSQAAGQPQPTATDVATRQGAEPTMTPGRGQPTQGQLDPFEANQGYGGFNDISLRISADRRYTDAGEPVRIRFTAINVGDIGVSFESEEGPIMDILVRYNPGGRDVIRDWWSEGHQITPKMNSFELAPGESRTIEMTWIPPDRIYSQPVGLRGILHDQHGKTDAWTSLCVEDGCAEY